MLFDHLGRPALEEADYAFLTVTIAFFEETRVLGVDYASFLIQYDEDGKTKAHGVAKSFHGGISKLLSGFVAFVARVIVDVDEDEVIFDDATDGGVSLGEIGKAQAPRTPVSANLTHNELTLRPCSSERLVNLFQRVCLFVIHAWQSCLCHRCDCAAKYDSSQYLSHTWFVFLRHKDTKK
jgi:hypothetical protein